MTFLEELELAVKERRERGDCGPYATGEENDLAAYEEIASVINERPELSDLDVAKEAVCFQDFVTKARKDLVSAAVQTLNHAMEYLEDQGVEEGAMIGNQHCPYDLLTAAISFAEGREGWNRNLGPSELFGVDYYAEDEQ